jgi:hypothetical protein
MESKMKLLLVLVTIIAITHQNVHPHSYEERDLNGPKLFDNALIHLNSTWVFLKKLWNTGWHIPRMRPF